MSNQTKQVAKPLNNIALALHSNEDGTEHSIVRLVFNLESGEAKVDKVLSQSPYHSEAIELFKIAVVENGIIG